ncbi:MAG: translation initiation factor IF-2 [Chlamydiae bacterium]|nr:translation initiation factor IF-2 [Chlamydiota bacterium]
MILAKNLKLNIKNTQLAEALKLSKLKKEPSGKKKVEPVSEEKAQPAEKKPISPEKKVSAPAESVVTKTIPPGQPTVQPVLPKATPPTKLPFTRKEAEEESKKPAVKETAAAETEQKKVTPKEPIAPELEEEAVKPKKGIFKEFRDFKPQKRTESRAFDSRDRHGLRGDGEEDVWRKKRAHKIRPAVKEDITIRPKKLLIRLPITVKDLATEMKLKSSELIAKLFMQGIVLTLNDYLDDETTVQLLGQEFDCEITIDTSEEQRILVTGKTIREEISEADPANLKIRPPVITFMGHVDHGKTSLIDAIRKSNLVSGEAGAITQHIGAFKCHTDVGDITILDTPGHEAFSAMRARGADVTDIIVLVIAGDEGMREQTLDAISKAREAKVPIVVALNKSDKPNFNPELVYRQLADQELLPEVWGGTTITVNCSAVTHKGIKELLEMLALQSEILELKANPNTRARGTVIESEMHKGMGPVATVLVQNGSLKMGDALVFDLHYGRVKTMYDEHEKQLQEAAPSTPVKITGLSGLPEAGSEFIVVSSEKEAREICEARIEQHEHKLSLKGKRATLESIFQKTSETKEVKILNIIIRADVQGSLEALKQSLFKIPTKKVETQVISENVGQISESDIELAIASGATIIGFHTQIESHAADLIQQKKIKVILHDVIYHIIDDVKSLMISLLDKIPQETEMGTALVKATFKSSQLGIIAGCIVTEGLIRRQHRIRLIRDDKEIWTGTIASLKRVKEDVKEVTKGHECGILLHNFSDIREGDILQTFEITYLEPEL